MYWGEGKQEAESLSATCDGGGDSAAPTGRLGLGLWSELVGEAGDGEEMGRLWGEMKLS